MKNLFYIALILFAGKNVQSLNLSTFYTNSRNIQVNEIHSSSFEQNDYVNSHEKNSICWIETSVPRNIFEEEQNVIFFGQEIFYQADVFIQDEHNEWNYLGKTGTGVKKSKKSIKSWLNCIYLPQNQYIDKNTSTSLIRIRIDTNHPSLIKLYLMPAKNFTSFVTALTAFFSLIAGICFSAIIFIIFTCITFKEYDGIFLAFLCFSLFIYIFLAAGIGNFYLWPYLTSIRNAYKISYFTITTAYLCLIMTIYKYYGKIPKTFPDWYYKFSTYYPLILIIVFTVGLFLCILPLSDIVFSFSLLFILVFLLGILLIQTYQSIMYNPVCNKKLISIWLFLAFLVFIQQCFLNFRFLFKNTRFLKLADQDFAIPQVLGFIVIAISTLYKLHMRIRTHHALAQINQEEVKEQIKEISKRNFVYSKLSTMLANPFQVISDGFENCKNKISAELYLNVNENLNLSRTLTYSLFALQNYEHFPENRRTDFEAIDLYNFIEEVSARDVAIFKEEGTFFDIQKKVLLGTCIFANRAFLHLILKFPLQLALKKAEPQTAVTISYEYDNNIFSYSIHFFSEPITRYESQILLNLELEEGEINEVSKDYIENIMKDWGVQMNIVKRIIELYHGQITILPDSQGNTISIKIALEPLPYSTFTSYSVENFENNFISAPEKSEKSEEILQTAETENGNLKKIFILDENPDIRKILSKKFSKHFKVFAYSSSHNLFNNIELESPDIILCSLTISGTNTFELLKSSELSKNIPFFVTAKNVSTSTIIELYKMGATEVFQKPFNAEVILQRILAVIRNRNNYAKMLISSVNETLQNSLFGSEKNTPPEQIAKIKEHASSTQQKSLLQKEVDNAAMNALFTSANLTEKEILIATLIASSKTDKEIATVLNISPATVATHNKNIYKKIGIHSRNELIEKLK